MASEAPQLSFMQGEVSPEYYYRSDLTNFNSSLSKAVNVKLEPLGGVTSRLGGNISVNQPIDYGGLNPVLNGSHSYMSCVFQHYITGVSHHLSVFNDGGSIKIYIDNTRVDTTITNMSASDGLNLRGDLLTGIKGLHFILHNDLLIFSKTLPHVVDKGDIDAAFWDYYLATPSDPDVLYTETQLCIRMMPDGSNKIESNMTLQNGLHTYSTTIVATTSKLTGIVGCATYMILAETSDGIDVVLGLANSIAGLNMPVSGSGTISDVIPFPVNNNSTNILNISSLTSTINSYGTKTLSKLKIYRASGKNVSFNGLYKLIAQFNISGAVSSTATDTGQEEAAYTTCSDTSALYKQPSLLSISDNPPIHTAVGGLKSVVDTAIFQQRAYYAINKGKWWGTSVYNNTIVASRINAPNQILYPQISNPREAFQFNVPEEQGGYLTHLASMSRLVAFTNTSTFIIQGDDAGIITPTSINPYKVLSFGCAEGVPPAISGETCVFANANGGIGYVSVNAEGQVIAGRASVLAEHLFKNKTVLSIEAAGDRKSLPRFLINTVEGDLIECYKVGDVFAFFPLHMESVSLGSAVGEEQMLPLTRSLSPNFKNSLYGADAVINIKRSRNFGFWDMVIPIYLTPTPRINTEVIDFASNIDLAVQYGASYGFDSADNKWISYRSHRVDETPANPAPRILTDASGNWLANTPIQLDSADMPLIFNPASAIQGSKVMRFYWMEDEKIISAYADIIEGAVAGEYFFEFHEDLPNKLTQGNANIIISEYSSSNIELEMRKGMVYADVAFNHLKCTSVDASVIYYNFFNKHCLARGIDITQVYGTVADPYEIPIVIETNGNIYGNYKDPTETIPVILKYYLDGGGDPYFEVELPEMCSYIVMGVPAIAEVETLPIASMGQDMTDANKNINYASVILYNTKGIRVGEVGQPDEYLEKFDFTTEESVGTPVPFSGPKSYNFSSSWNEHGMIRVSGMDLQPFTLSGIIPKGNIGGF